MHAGQNPVALLQQGIALHNRGQVGEAERWYRSALALAPKHPDALHLLALCRLQQGDAPEAEKLVRKALAVNAKVAMFHNTLGETLRLRGKLKDAEAAYRQALRIDPNQLDAEANLGLVFEARGELDAAAMCALKVFRARPGDFAAGLRVLQRFVANRQREMAERFAEELLARFDARTPEAVFGEAAAALSALKSRALALRVAERWGECHPASRHARLCRASLLAGMHREDEAISMLEALLPDPDLGREALTALALACQSDGRGEAAMRHFERILALVPDDPVARRGRAQLLLDAGRTDEALAGLRALADTPEGRFDLAMALLVTGDFDAGWEAHEARAEKAGGDTWVWRRKMAMPRWQGEALAGKRLLIVAEQGAGDFVQFARFLPELAAAGARLVIETPPELRALVALAAPQASLVARGEALPAADFWCPLMSLPFVLGRGGEVAAPVPYLHVDPAAVARWRERLRAAGAERAVGVCWAGAAHHPGDPWRSCAAKDFERFGDVSGVHFVCLQKDRRDEGVPVLPDWLAWSGELASFADTAALVAALDAVVTVDTSIAHLAGALGVPCAVLITRVPDWRWQLGRSDSPWYPSLRLFRQLRQGDWQAPLAQARDWLAAASPSR